MTDPLDMPSGVGVEEWKPAEPWMLHVREMTFRELEEQSRRNMKDWDRYTPFLRHRTQVVNDPHYTIEIKRMKRGIARAST